MKAFLYAPLGEKPAVIIRRIRRETGYKIDRTEVHVTIVRTFSISRDFDRVINALEIVIGNFDPFMANIGQAIGCFRAKSDSLKDLYFEASPQEKFHSLHIAAQKVVGGTYEFKQYIAHTSAALVSEDRVAETRRHLEASRFNKHFWVSELHLVTDKGNGDPVVVHTFRLGQKKRR